MKNFKFQINFAKILMKKLGYYNIWIINGEYHRTLGPAIDNEFWYRGEKNTSF
jgi:hypothetical protein